MSPVRASDKRAVRSLPHERTRVPSGLKEACMAPRCPRRTRSCRPLLVSQIATVPSAPAVTTRAPSGLNAARATEVPGPTRWRSRRPVAASQIAAVPSSLAVRMRDASRLYRALLTPAPWRSSSSWCERVSAVRSASSASRVRRTSAARRARTTDSCGSTLELRARCRRELPRASRVRVGDCGVALQEREDREADGHGEREADRGKDLPRAARSSAPAGEDIRHLKSRRPFTVLLLVG